MEKWRCTVCGYIHEGPLSEDFTCPRCRKPASVFEEIEEPKGGSRYAGTKTEKNLREAFAGERDVYKRQRQDLPPPLC